MEFNKPSILCVSGSNVSENFKRFQEDIEIYFTATKTNNESREIQVARLKNLMGPEARKIYTSLSQCEPSKETVKSILGALEKHCLPKRNECMEIFKFFNRKQNPGESFEKFFVDLKTLVKSCEFGDQEEKLLKAQVILGTNNKQTQQRLLMTENNATLEKIKEYCSSVEETESNIRVLAENKHAEESSVEICQIINKKGFQCSSCGYVHEKNKCGAYGKQCTKCQRFNHYASVCRSKTQYNQNRNGRNRNKVIHSVSENKPPAGNSVPDDEEVSVNIKSISPNICEDPLVSVIAVSEIKSTSNKWFENIEVEDKLVEFKIDTGAQTNVIPLSLFKSLSQDIQVRLQETPIRLQVYGGFLIKPVGVVNLNVKLKNHCVLSSFFVVSESNCKPILGLELSRLLELVPYPSNVKINDIVGSKILSREEFISKNTNVFSGLGCIPGELNLKLKPNAIPVSNPARRVPYNLMDRLKSTLDTLESRGIIAKTEPFEWCSNMVVTEKKSGDLRICIDPQQLNTNLLRDYYLIPTLDQLCSEIGNKKFYCVFDLKDGYYQVKLDEQSSKLCTFSSPFGLYRYLRSPFGLSVLPEHFQKLTHNLFGNIPGVKVYFDNIIVGADTQEELYNVVNKLIEVASLNNVKFNPEKLQYFVSEVSFLGMKFNSLGIKADENRVLAIKNLQAPKNKKDLQSILGMINFLRPFIPNLSDLIVPFKNLLKNDVIFSWNKTHEEQLDKIKSIICNLSLLSNFNVTKPIVVQADASQFAIGCSLLQDDKPVFFASRCLSKSECEFAQIEKELLSVSFAFKKFHNFLYGHKNVTVYTDHSPLVSIIKKPLSNIPNNRLRRLRLKLMPYFFELKYLPGKKW